MELVVGIFLIYIMYSTIKKIGKTSNSSVIFRLFEMVLSAIFSVISFVFQLIFQNYTDLAASHFVPWYRTSHLSKHNNGISVNGSLFLDAETSCTHTLISAVSGAGKTTCNIINSVYNISKHKSGSIVVTDPSSEIFKLTKNLMERRGFTVFYLNINDPATNTFNPLSYANSNSEIDTTAKELVFNGSDSSSGDQFWNLSAAGLLSILIKILKKSDFPEEKVTLATLKDWVNKVSTPSLREEINNLAVHLPDELYNEYLSIISMPEKTFGGVVASAKVAMGNVYENVQHLTNTNTINLDDLRSSNKAIYYICTPEHEQKKYAFINNLFYGAVFNKLYEPMREDDGYVFLLLDEFGNMKIDNFSEILTTARKRKISITIILQAFEQLRKYGSEYQVILDNCKTKVFYGGMGVSTCNEVSRLAGSTPRKSNGLLDILNKKRNRLGYNESVQIITTDELRRLDDEILILHANEFPTKVKPRPYYKNKTVMKELKG